MKNGKYYCEVFIDGWEWYPDEESEDAELDESVYVRYVLLPNGDSCTRIRNGCGENVPKDYKFNYGFNPSKKLSFDDVSTQKAEDFLPIIRRDYLRSRDFFPEVTVVLYTVFNENGNAVIIAKAQPAESKPLVITYCEN